MQYTQGYSNLNTGAALAGDGGFAGAEDDERVEVDENRQNGLKLWEGKYEFRKEMLPSFVGEVFGKKVSNNFKLVNGCADT